MSTILTETILKASAIGRDGIIQAFEEQGHHLTGEGEASFTDDVSDIDGDLVLTAQAVKYMITQEFGFTADDFKGSWQGAVAPLKAWFMSRGMDEKTALRLAVATAKKQKEFGMPLKGAYQFSTTGQRTGYMEIGLEQNKPQMDEVIALGIHEYLVDLQHEYKND